MKSILDVKTTRMLEEARKQLKSANNTAGTYRLLKRVYPDSKPTKKKVEFIEFLRLLHHLRMKYGTGVLLLTWYELAFILKGNTFKDSRGGIKNTFIKQVKEHVSDLVRLGAMDAVPTQYRFCIAPVPEKAFDDRWHQRIPSDSELDSIYKAASGRGGGYAGVYISVITNGSVLMAYLNKNVRIGQKIADNGKKVVEGAVAAGLISPETKEVFGLSATQLRLRDSAETRESREATSSNLALPFVPHGRGFFRRIAETQS